MTPWQALQDKWRFLDSEFIHHKTHVGQLALFKEVGGPTIVQCSGHRSATHNNGEDLFVRYMHIIAPLALHFFGPAYLYNYRCILGPCVWIDGFFSDYHDGLIVQRIYLSASTQLKCAAAKAILASFSR